MPEPRSSRSPILRIAVKEITLFFSNPSGYLFLAGFAALNLFIFFWGESFFARNIADVRPLFEWMPLLLLFLTSALTMRAWSEERRSGTLEHVLTLPIPLWNFVIGKFLGCLALLTIAVAVTAPLPLTVAWLGDLDWGPVLCGYLATLLLGAAYLAVGLFASAISTNAIVSLLTSVALTGSLYLLGSPMMLRLTGEPLTSLLSKLGTGSRFDSITRGVLDLRDLGYYLSLLAIFLTLNALALEFERWSKRSAQSLRHSRVLVCGLLIANALVFNLWFDRLDSLRIDTTEGRLYSVTETTTKQLQSLTEPLLLRGYFSQKTHPALAPLVPQLKDLLQEYAQVGGARVKVEFVDPSLDETAADEAYSNYGITPLAFQVADRHQAAIVNTYFNVLVQYGTEHQVLSFAELIEVKGTSESDFEVRLRNPEYDLTKAVRKASQSYRSSGDLFRTLPDQVTLKAYLSPPDLLPEQLAELYEQVVEVSEKLAAEYPETFAFEVVDPSDPAIAEQLQHEYGFRPMAADLMSGQTFYFYLTLQDEEQVLALPLDDFSEASFERNLKDGLKRFAGGLGHTVALVTPEPGPDSPRFELLREFLQSEMTVLEESLDDGVVAAEADLLLLMAPRELSDEALYAVDSFLMRGGSVLIAASPFAVELGQNGIQVSERATGLTEWYESFGLSQQKSLLLDPHCSTLAVPVTRYLGGMAFQELRMLEYPYFIDVRRDSMADGSPAITELAQVTVPWVAPLSLDEDRLGDLEAVELLSSSTDSWLSPTPDIAPRDPDDYLPTGSPQSRALAYQLTGSFPSYFADKEPPKSLQGPLGQRIEKSPENTKLVLFGSADLVRDEVISLMSTSSGTRYLNSLQLIANAIDWAVDDTDLAAIRGQAHFNRTLPPLERNRQLFWEYLNYALALLALGVVAGVRNLTERKRRQRFRMMMMDSETLEVPQDA